MLHNIITSISVLLLSINIIIIFMILHKQRQTINNLIQTVGHLIRQLEQLNQPPPILSIMSHRSDIPNAFREMIRTNPASEVAKEEHTDKNINKFNAVSE